MKAVVVDRWMEPSELRVSEIPDPVAGPGELLVEIRAAGCNFFDMLLVRGQYQSKPKFPFIPGAELAGEVVAVGEGVSDFAAGDRVLASLASSPSGAYAERIAIPASTAWRMPESMSFDEGAAFPIVYPTSYSGLVFRGQLRRGENLLVHAAVQIGKALGARVLATAGGAEKLEIARRAGADVAIDYRDEDWVERVKQETGGKGADVIYDSVGGDVFDGSMKCIAFNGRLLVIGFAGGRIPEVKANRILLKNVAVVGLHWGAYAIHEPARIPETFEALFRLHRESGVRPVIFDRRYALADLPEALAALGSRKTWGKVIVHPGA